MFQYIYFKSGAVSGYDCTSALGNLFAGIDKALFGRRIKFIIRVRLKKIGNTTINN